MLRIAPACGIVLVAFVFPLRISSANRPVDIAQAGSPFAPPNATASSVGSPTLRLLINGSYTCLQGGGSFSTTQLSSAVHRMRTTEPAPTFRSHQSCPPRHLSRSTCLLVRLELSAVSSHLLRLDVQQPLPAIPQQFHIYLPDGSIFTAAPADL